MLNTNSLIGNELHRTGKCSISTLFNYLANAYTYNHDRLASDDLGTMEFLFLHMVDAVGMVHAIILRKQALVQPVKMLVFLQDTDIDH